MNFWACLVFAKKEKINDLKNIGKFTPEKYKLSRKANPPTRVGMKVYTADSR